jgi:hypothetical protein
MLLTSMSEILSNAFVKPVSEIFKSLAASKSPFKVFLHQTMHG